MMKSMATIFILHGLGGSPEENWFPWLTHELEDAGHVVHSPQFPNAEKPELKEWLRAFKTYEKSIDETAVLVGHSLGGALAMRYLEQAKQPVQATFLVASVFGLMGNDIDPLIPTFNTAPYDFQAIVQNGGDIHVVHSDNDPYIPLPQAEEAALNLMVPMDLLHGGGHLNMPEFPELRDMILASVI